MKILWEFEENDIIKIKQFYESNKKSLFVQNRIKKNIEKQNIQVTNDVFWEVMVRCLLTTQQRSGPNSAVTKFICTKPFPLAYEFCKKENNLKGFVEQVITEFGSIRRGKTIGEHIEENYKWLNSIGWQVVHNIINDLSTKQSILAERKAATAIKDKFCGFGPKQSRNLLQALGLTKFEIPIDSRITKWLNDFGFPIKLSSTALSDENYYNFIMDGFQKISEAIGTYPCVLDAVIFSSFDDEWTEDKLVW